MSTKGVLMYGVNNDTIDYISIAIVNAKLVKRYMNVPVSLVTDEAGSTHPKLEESDVFDLILVDDSKGEVNTRNYRDTLYHAVSADFKNFSRPSAYDISPYDETLLIDVDYIIQDDSLNLVWGSVEELLINNKALSLEHKPLRGEEFRLNPFGIRMFWATVIYFKKTENVRILFDMVKHIKDHWEFYKLTYDFPSMMYRNDYAFSIAIHTINGFLENDEIKSLPIPYILTATDRDQIYKVTKDGLLMFINDPNIPYKFTATKLSNINIHCMNKLSLLRNLADLEATCE